MDIHEFTARAQELTNVHLNVYRINTCFQYNADDLKYTVSVTVFFKDNKDRSNFTSSIYDQSKTFALDLLLLKIQHEAIQIAGKLPQSTFDF